MIRTILLAGASALALGGTAEASSSIFTFSGIAKAFTAAAAGMYRIDVWGAQGGAGGNQGGAGGAGAGLRGDFYLSAGETLTIDVGGRGTDGADGTFGNGGGGGGGGGSFVVGPGGRLIIAGGGGGGAGGYNGTGAPGATGQKGEAGSDGAFGGAGGTGGQGGGGYPSNNGPSYGGGGGGGGGFLSDGLTELSKWSPAIGGRGFSDVTGGEGAHGGPYYYGAKGGRGGFGGGGGGGAGSSYVSYSGYYGGSYRYSTPGGGGGGGGFSGGGGGYVYGAGGGGGSFNAGLHRHFLSWRLGDGEVSISPVAVPEPSVWSLLLTGLGLLGYALRRRLLGPVRRTA
jgi:hypothetical protein